MLLLKGCLYFSGILFLIRSQWYVAKADKQSFTKGSETSKKKFC